MAGAKRSHIYISGSLIFSVSLVSMPIKQFKQYLHHAFQSANRDNGCEDILKF